MRYQGLRLSYNGISFYSRMFRNIFQEYGGSENKLPQNTETIKKMVTIENFGNMFFELRPFVPSSRKQRVFVTCPACSRVVPAGRLAQHINTGRCI